LDGFFDEDMRDCDDDRPVAEVLFDRSGRGRIFFLDQRGEIILTFSRRFLLLWIGWLKANLQLPFLIQPTQTKISRGHAQAKRRGPSGAVRKVKLAARKRNHEMQKQKSNSPS
jgi:hypothetical protein